MSTQLTDFFKSRSFDNQQWSGKNLYTNGEIKCTKPNEKVNLHSLFQIQSYVICG